MGEYSDRKQDRKQDRGQDTGQRTGQRAEHRHEPPSVRGYEVEELVGYGATGEVWRARESLSGDLVALKVVRVDRAGARDRLRREAATLAGLASQHVVRMRTVVTAADSLVLVSDFAGRGNLASLLALRRELHPGEVVTLGVAVARGLADVHSAGLVHGDISPANILFADDGRPMLSDLGVARWAERPGCATAGEPETTPEYADPAVLAGAPLTAAADVYALAAVCSSALGDGLGDPQAVAGVRAVLDIAMGEHDARPDAARFAAELHAVCPARPLRLAGATVPSDPPPTVISARSRVEAAPEAPVVQASRERFLSWLPAQLPSSFTMSRAMLSRVALVVLAFGALVVAVGAGVWWAHTATADAQHVARRTPTTTPTITTEPSLPRSTPTRSVSRSPSARSPAPIDWSAVVSALDARRDLAFATGDAGLLRDVYAPASKPLAQDSQALAALTARGLHALGLRLALRDVRATRVADSTAALEVSDVLTPYTVVDATGAVAARYPGRGLQCWRLVLVRVGGGWRIGSITPMP